MKLLHSEYVEASRFLRASAPEGTEVLQAGEHDYPVSAYPSVVVTLEASEYQIPMYGTDGELLGVQWTGNEEYEEVLRMPVSWDAVLQYVNFKSKG